MAEVAEGALVDGRYRIKSRIGSGGMADVYCAEDRQLGRDIALKVLHRRFARDREFVERFRREASSAAKLQHPHVVNVFDRGEHDGTYYIAMERLEGPTLKELITQDAPLDQLRAIDLCLQILQAAGFAHRHGVVHRDFKPHNAIVGAGDRVKVTDFGIARAGASEMTETGSIMGTAQYLSPEQAQGQRVGPESDLYSIGVILYEMLTGDVPFGGESAVAIALKHVSEIAPPLRSVRPDAHPLLEATVARALAKEPERRFGDADQFIAALEAARRAIEAGDDGGGTGDWAAVGALEDAPEEEGGSSRRPLVALVIAGLALAAAAIAFALMRPEQVEVPRVVGERATRASDTLERRGFEVKLERVRDPAAAGTVIDQDPRGGEEAEEGSTVTLEVSAGPGTVLVPSVKNLPQQEAVRTLNRLGFKVDTDTTPSARVPEGTAIRTSPRDGTAAPRGSRVRLFVSSGPEQVSVPSVVGRSRGSAEAALRNAGLQVSVDERESDEPEGQVIAQDPRGGARVDEGAQVAITVSKGQERVAVPGVVGRSRADATAALRSAGFSVNVVEKETDDAADGTVFRQRPPAGSRRERGSSVTIYVATEPPPDADGPGGEDGEPVPDPDADADSGAGGGERRGRISF